MLHSLNRRLLQWLLDTRDIQRLEQLDDKLLADIGIARHEIAIRVRGRT
jgi:uncharacterized protein YjiS (DUF1127 family)